jgi:hypothetical protein
MGAGLAGAMFLANAFDGFALDRMNFKYKSY